MKKQKCVDIHVKPTKEYSYFEVRQMISSSALDWLA